jgi:hypothetical protein
VLPPAAPAAACTGRGLLVLLARLAFDSTAAQHPAFALVGVPVLVELADGALREAAGAGRRWAARHRAGELLTR